MMFYQPENNPTVVTEDLTTQVPVKRFNVTCTTTGKVVQSIEFHSGPMGNGVNGVLMEDLLKCVLLRLDGFQQGPYACEENAQAMEHIQKAIQELDVRTARMTGSSKN